MALDSMHKILFMEGFKVRRHLWNVIRSVAFLLILALSLYGINQVLLPKYIYRNSDWPTTSTYNQFYEMEQDTVDVLFFGSSVAVNAFSPQEIYNTYGIRSYNLGSEQQSIFLSYYWLKEALRFQSPKVVVLDTRFLFQQHPDAPINTTEGLIRKCLDPMRWSGVKAEAVADLCELDPSQSELSYYLTNIRFHSRWSSLKEYDFALAESQRAELKGFSAIADYGPEVYSSYTPGDDLESKAETHAVMQEYMDRFVELCKAEGIALVLVSLPGNSMSDAVNHTLTSYAEAHDIDYYNFCETELYQSIGAVLPRENMIGHENLWGAMRMSRFMGEMLANTYHVPSVEDEQYESTKEFYEHIIKNCELSHITDINEYLSMLQEDDNYTIFISSMDECTAGLTDEIIENLRGLGLRQDLTGKFRWCYCAVVSPENGIEEQIGEDRTSLSGVIPSGRTTYAISSIGKKSVEDPGDSSVVIDGVEYSVQSRGLNIVVYDNLTMKVVDSVCFDTYYDSGAMR